jgi:2-phospho-L-lactate/phosphoenolpyruvate guanylyltransferase
MATSTTPTSLERATADTTGAPPAGDRAGVRLHGVPRSPRPVVALVPFRCAPKSRLSDVLDDDARVELATAMLADVLAAVAGAPVDRLVVAAGDPEAARRADALGVEVLRDPADAGGLDGAVAAAATRLPAAATLVVVMADLPRLAPADVAAVVATDAAVVVAATGDGGTGALLRRPPDVVPTAYGPGSAARHAALASTAGVTVSTVRSPGFARDLDTPEDLADLSPGEDGLIGAHTRAWLDGASRLGTA